MRGSRGPCHLAEVLGSKVRLDTAEVGMVEDIEHFGAKLNRIALPNVKVSDVASVAITEDNSILSFSAHQSYL